MPKTYAIADLHGRSDLLKAALKLAQEHSGPDPFTFVCTGDMVDRGRDSAGIIKIFRQLHEDMLNGKTDNKYIVLKGNHEDMMFEVMTKGCDENGWVRPDLLNWWLGNGGGRTLLSYGYTNESIHRPRPYIVPLAQDLLWLKHLPIYHYDDHRIFVHAGFNETLPLEEQKEEYMMWRYEKEWKDIDYSFMGKFVVHGHIQDEANPYRTANKINLDAFAWWTGKLPIAVFDDAVPGGPEEILWVEGPSETELG